MKAQTEKGWVEFQVKLVKVRLLHVRPRFIQKNKIYQLTWPYLTWNPTHPTHTHTHTNIFVAKFLYTNWNSYQRFIFTRFLVWKKDKSVELDQHCHVYNFTYLQNTNSVRNNKISFKNYFLFATCCLFSPTYFLNPKQINQFQASKGWSTKYFFVFFVLQSA
jgi:hypothetical protein